MLETLAYAATALIIVVVLVKVTPSGTSIAVLGMLVIGILAVLAAARHGPESIAAVLNALSKLIRG